MAKFNEGDIFGGRYRLEKKLGVGGFSEVWQAADQMAEGLVVAIKIFAPGNGLDEHGIRQFRKEYALTAPLKHPHLLKASYYDVFEGSPYLILPYCANGSLGHKLAIQEHLPEEEIWEVVQQVGNALTYLHGKGILHQDIKPDNVLIEEDGTYLLSDFGISNRLRSTLRKSTGATHSMTTAYAPPERFEDRPKTTEKGDIFSLGVMIYELATGDVPWVGHGGVALLNGAKVPQLPETYSTALNNLARRCMSLHPEDRPEAIALGQQKKKTASSSNLIQEKKVENLPTSSHKLKRNEKGQKDDAFAIIVGLGTIIFFLLIWAVYYISQVSFYKEQVDPIPQIKTIDQTTPDTQTASLNGNEDEKSSTEPSPEEDTIQELKPADERQPELKKIPPKAVPTPLDSVKDPPVKSDTTQTKEKESEIPIPKLVPIDSNKHDRNKNSNAKSEGIKLPELQVLNGETGHSYVIVGSIVDFSLVRDFSYRLQEREFVDTIYIIKPFGKTSLLYRVAIDRFLSFEEAMNKVEDYRVKYGPETWVLKY